MLNAHNILIQYFGLRCQSRVHYHNDLSEHFNFQKRSVLKSKENKFSVLKEEDGNVFSSIRCLEEVAVGQIMN